MEPVSRISPLPLIGPAMLRSGTDGSTSALVVIAPLPAPTLREIVVSVT